MKNEINSACPYAFNGNGLFILFQKINIWRLHKNNTLRHSKNELNHARHDASNGKGFLKIF